jgi:hypothetical protein
MTAIRRRPAKSRSSMGFVSAAILAALVVLYALYVAWRERRDLKSRRPFRRFVVFVGLFVIIYAAIVAIILISLSLLGVNFTLVTSFLSAPLWIVCVLFARAFARRASFWMI